MGDEAELTPGYKATDLKWLKSTLRQWQFARGFMGHAYRESFGTGYRREVWKGGCSWQCSEPGP